MTEKRFTCHQMIADYSTIEDIDFDFLQELIDEQRQPKDLRMHISDGNKILTYRECVNLLNGLSDENEQLKSELRFLRDFRGFITEKNVENEQQRKGLQLQMLRLYNYFEDYFEDTMSPENFSEMWDIVKESEKWEKR